MSKQENNEKNNQGDQLGKFEKTITYVYVPDEQAYGYIVSYGAYASLIEFNANGVGYQIELENDEFEIIEEVGIGYIDETDELL